MAKKRMKSKQTKKVRVKPRVPRVIPDAYLQYARLLTDPCTGPLVHAPGSSEGGQVTRFETDVIYGSGATETCGFINWSPGGYNSAATPQFGNGIISVNGATDAGNLTPSSASVNTYCPGFTFLAANAGSYRCIAACLQLYWPGSELNRQGVVGVAQSTLGLVGTSQTVTCAQMRSLCPVVERMPGNMVEAKWAPNFADGLFRSPGGSQEAENGHSALLATWAGIPVSTGVRIRLVIVVEWRPKIAGLVLSSNTSVGSSGEMQQVRRALDARSASWWHISGQVAWQFLSGMTVAYAAHWGQSFPRITDREL
nr:MAG: putative coat protein [Tombusviridae sp.]